MCDFYAEGWKVKHKTGERAIKTRSSSLLEIQVPFYSLSFSLIERLCKRSRSHIRKVNRVKQRPEIENQNISSSLEQQREAFFKDV